MSYDPEQYGRDWADEYDDLYDRLDPATVETVADLAADGRVLEFGIGTGRIALPLARRGLDVTGIDGSPQMVAKLREKPGGDTIPVEFGDFATTRVDGTFGVVLLAFNTLFALTDQDSQVACFVNAAHHLGPDGVFMLDAFVPDLGRYRNGQSVTTTGVRDDEVMLDAALHDPVAQRVRSNHMRITEHGTRLLPVTVRYAWPAEMDLMARLAGLRLRDRWAWWDKTPFTATSGRHVSVYEHAA